MKKKVLFLTVKFDTGGTEKVTYDIITHLNPQKYDITLMTMYAGGYYQDHLPEYIHVKWFFPKFVRFVIRLVTWLPGKWVYKYFIREKYDVEIACGDDIPSRVINHSVNSESRKIAWIHMDVMERGYRGYEMKTERGKKRFYCNFDSIVNVSKECEGKFKLKFGSDLPTCTIYNPIPENEIREKASLEPELFLPEDKFNIICAGRFTPQKGFDRLIEACARLDSFVLGKIHITILGDGYERVALEDQIADAELSCVIDLPGYIENPYSVMKQADLFVLSSRDESFSLVVAEAMVLGIPIMSTTCTGPVELLKNGQAGYLTENSTEGIYKGLEDILTNENTYQYMKSVALQNTMNSSIEQQITKIEALLDQ